MSSVMFQTDTARRLPIYKENDFSYAASWIFPNGRVSPWFRGKYSRPFSLFLVEIGLQMMFGYALDRYESLSS